MKISRIDFLKASLLAVGSGLGISGAASCSEDATPTGGTGGKGGSSGGGGAGGHGGGDGGSSSGSGGMTGGKGGTGGTGGNPTGGKGGTSTGGSSGGTSTGGSSMGGAGTGGGGAGGSAGSSGTGGGGGSGGGGTGCSKVNATIGTPAHPHVLEVPAADVTTGTAKQYTMTGMHTHMVSVTADHFTQLKAGTEVTVNTSTDSGHMHEVKLKCGT